MSKTTLSDRNAGKWMIDLFNGSGPMSRAVIAAPLLGGALLVMQAWMLAEVLHQAIANHVALTALAPSIIFLVGLVLCRVGISVAGDIMAIVISERLKRGLRLSLFQKLLARGPLWTAAQPSGALSTLAAEQVEALDGFFVRYIPTMIQSVVLPIAFAAIIFPIDWVVGLIFLITAPLIPVFMMLAGWGAQAATRSQARSLSRLTTRFADRLRGMQTLKLFGREAAETAAIKQAGDELAERNMRVMRVAFLSSAVLEFFAALGVAGVALYIGLTFLGLIALHGSLSLQAGLFCLLMAPEVYQPLRLLAAHYHDRASANAAALEIHRQLGELPPVAQPRQERVDLPKPAMARGGIAVAASGLTIASLSGTPLLIDTQLRIDAGAHIAIMGTSGIGKSTLLETIARLRPYAGTLTLGDTDLAAFPETDFRDQVAMLAQRPSIFAGSIADNIKLGRAYTCATAVRLAAQRACVTDFADALPLGLDTPIGENGIGLSGGEIQRVALARIYLRNPALILLDEPTANLDPATELLVLESLLDFARHRTLIIATHSYAVASQMARSYRIVGQQLLSTATPHAAPHLRRGAA